MEALTPETALVLRVRLEKVAREGRCEEAAANGARALQLLDGAPRWQPNIDCCDELARIGLALAKMGMMGEGAPVERLLERVLHSPTAGTNALRTATAALKLAVGADFDAFCACAFGAEAGGHQGCGDGGPPPPLDALPSLELIGAILELMDEPTCPLLARRATPSMQAALRSASRATRQRALELTSRFVHTAPSAMCGLVPLLSSAVFNETAELASYALAALADAADATGAALHAPLAAELGRLWAFLSARFGLDVGQLRREQLEDEDEAPVLVLGTEAEAEALGASAAS